MNLTTEFMQRWVGGQLEVTSKTQGILCRSQIRRVWVEENSVLWVEFEYVCMYNRSTGGYMPYSPTGRYPLTRLGLIGASASGFGEGRLVVNVGPTNEIWVFFPPKHHKKVLSSGKMQVRMPWEPPDEEPEHEPEPV